MKKTVKDRRPRKSTSNQDRGKMVKIVKVERPHSQKPNKRSKFISYKKKAKKPLLSKVKQKKSGLTLLYGICIGGPKFCGATNQSSTFLTLMA